MSVRLSNVTLAIEGMTCAACTSSISNGLLRLPGVEDVSVSLITQKGHVRFDGASVSVDQIKETVEDCGFDAEVLNVDVEEEESRLPNASVPNETVKLKIFGMTCSACSSSIENALNSLDGVMSATVALTTEEARISYDPNVIAGPRLLISTIEDVGFDAILSVSADNTSQIEALARVKEIKQYFKDTIICLCLSVPVIVITKLVPNALPFLSFLKTKVSPHVTLYWDDLINFLLTLYIQFGIGKMFYIHSFKAIRNGSPNMDVLVSMSTTCSYVFSLFSCIYSLVKNTGVHPVSLWETSAMIFTFVVFGKYLESRAKGQTSVALSRLISLVPSTAVIYEDVEKYYEVLESQKDRSVVLGGDDAKSSATISTTTLASPISLSLREKQISTDLLQPNDIVIIRPGEMVPADGVILTGESYISEALITGESYPILKKPGLSVIGGSVNGRGKLECKITRSGNNTKLSQIVRLVEDAQINKAPVQRYADWAAGYFVPTVLVLALGTFAVWMIISHLFTTIRPAVFNKEEGEFMVCLRLCISVIVVACPCALGLATPTAVMVATGVGAEYGILIKGGSALEVGNNIDMVLFDKTGTLTYGKMSVTSCEILGEEISERLFWLLVGSAEQGSEHPVAKSLVYQAKRVVGIDQDISFNSRTEDFKVLIGEGVTAKITLGDEHYELAIGSLSMLTRLGVKDTPKFSNSSSSSTDFTIDPIDETLALVAINGEYSGLIQLSDPIKPEAKDAVAALQRLGLQVGMISGDNSLVARKVGEAVGIPPSLVFSEISPGGKIEIIRKLQGEEFTSTTSDIESGDKLATFSSRRRVAMVGDGINDSPALAASSLGIAMAGATDVAMEAADVVLLREKALLDIPAAFDLSRKAYGRIKFNLIAAVIYNLIMIPFAMGFFLPFGMMISPMMASAAMAMSSVSVLISSLLLQLWKPPKWISNNEQEFTHTQMEQMNIETPPPSQPWYQRIFPLSTNNNNYSAL